MMTQVLQLQMLTFQAAPLMTNEELLMSTASGICPTGNQGNSQFELE